MVYTPITNLRINYYKKRKTNYTIKFLINKIHVSIECIIYVLISKKKHIMYYTIIL